MTRLEQAILNIFKAANAVAILNIPNDKSHEFINNQGHSLCHNKAVEWRNVCCMEGSEGERFNCTLPHNHEGNHQAGTPEGDVVFEFTGDES